jgi:hypothetical protein
MKRLQTRNISVLFFYSNNIANRRGNRALDLIEAELVSTNAAQVSMHALERFLSLPYFFEHVML